MANPRKRKGRKKKKLSKEEQEALQREEAERLWKEEQERLAAQKIKDEVEFRHRNQQLADSMIKFQNLENEVAAHKALQKSQNEWVKFINPTKLPPGDSPQKIRNFLYRLQREELKDVTNQIDYRLNVDEHCMLTQDTRIKDVTMKRLTELHENPGERFYGRIHDLMCVLKEMEKVLEDAGGFTKPTIDDLLDLKRQIRQLIEEQLSKFSLHVLANVNQEMCMIDPWRSHQQFSDVLLSSHFWTFRDPLPPTIHAKGTEVNLSNVNISARIPPELDLRQASVTAAEENPSAELSVTGFWLHYDHLSDTLENFEFAATEPPTLLTLNQTEFARREDLASQKLAQMIAARAEYDEKCRQEAILAAEKAANKRGKRGDKKEATKIKKKKKSKKGKNETPEIIPPVVDISTLVDVEDELKAEIIEQFEEHKQNLGPKNMEEHEINIRESEITTGIFHLRCFEKVWQPKEFENHLSLNLVKKPHVLKPKAFHQIYDPNPLAFSLTCSSLSMEAPSNPLSLFGPPQTQINKDVEAAIQENEEKLQKLIHVTLKLPENVFWWEEPIIGCWEEGMSDVPQTEEIVEYTQSCEVIQDFILSNIPETIELDKLIPIQIMPRIPNGYKFHSELAADFEKSKKLHKKQAKFGGTEVDKNLNHKNPKILAVKTPPKDLFPAPVRIPRLAIVDRITEIPEPVFRSSIDDDDDDEPFPNEPDTTLAEFVNSLVPLRAKDQPYFRNYSQIALFQDEEVEEESNLPIVPLEEEKVPSETFSLGSSVGKFDFSERRQKSKWSKRNVHGQFYDETRKILSFYLNRFYSFAVTTRKYCNFPLKSWKLVPNGRNSVILTLVAKLLTVEIEVTVKGYKMNLLLPRKTFFKPIAQPMELDDFIHYAKSVNLNVFTDDDAGIYVADAPLKLPTLEQHTYQCMACFCSTHEFHSSVWNKLADYRTIFVDARVVLAQTPEAQEVRVTTERAEFVETEKRATEFETDGVNVEFHRKVGNQEFKADLYNLLLSDDSWTSSGRKVLRQTPALLQYNVLKLLQSIRPFSFS